MTSSNTSQYSIDAAPRVTVFVPAFNAERYLAAAIESVLAQTWPDFELLLIDDGSIDATHAVMQTYAHDPRVRIVRHARNLGRPMTRNDGLDRARGEYIALLDADDVCAPDRLRLQLAYLEAHPQIAVLGSRSGRINATGGNLPAPGDEPLTADEIHCQMLFQCRIHQPTVMARTQALSAYRYDDRFAYAEDYDLWTRMLGAHRFANLPRRLTSYRRHPAQATSATENAVERDWKMIHGRQLAALGIQATAEELLYHGLLHRGRRFFRTRTGRGVDLAYVRWARRWLEDLVAANAAVRLYPEPTFSRVAGRLWWFVCRKATQEAGIGVWREFARSSLCQSVASAWSHDLRLWARRAATSSVRSE